MKLLKAILVLLIAISLLCIASAESDAYEMRPMVGVATDYSLAENWVQLPAVSKAVDTIYFYPTVYISAEEGAPAIVPVDNPILRAGARSIFGRQASVFEESTNVFAPYYRQSNLAVLIGKDDKEFMEFQYQEQRTDVYAALDYYFEHLNEGRPFILAGHSQGSMMVKIALREYFKAHADLLDRMVAAYVIGFSITQEDLDENPALKFAEGPDDTGVIVSWNTEGPENKDAYSAVVTEGAMAINPISWTRDDGYVPAGDNPGSRMLSPTDGQYRDIAPGVADAQIDPERGVVVCTTLPDSYISMDEGAENPFGPASLHGVDYDAYYYSIQENVAARIRAFEAADAAVPEVDGIIPTDYSDPENWYKIPEITKGVDTFFIYPTVYTNYEEGAPDYAPLGDPMMLAGVEGVYQLQACAFEESTNLFIPYYRQANITIEVDTFDALGDIQTCLADNLPEIDVNAALDYYFEHYNHGRPFIIAGHSQGSAMTRMVLKRYFKDHPEYYKRMVAAYVIGYSVTQQDLEENPHLKFAEGADDTGVIVSWNIEGPGNAGAANIARVEGAISINPLNWKRDDTYASAEENLGSRVQVPGTMNIEYMDIGADAQVDAERGVVITHADYPFISGTNPKTGLGIFGPESFHNGDYSFYFDNIKQNVRTRINSYWKLSEEDRVIILDFINEFKLIASVPRPSKHEQAISDFLKDWAEERGYTVKQNEACDLIFDVPATQGYEALPLTALQAHMDMVCIGAEGVDYDPLTDPVTIKFDLDEATMTADGTSLGADDGAGVAMIMAIVDGGMDHGPLRVIFTTDEEVEMTGAMAITAEDLDGVKYLVNIDSEESDTVTVSTAADSTIIAAETPRTATPSGDTALTIKLSGLKGGHSGIEIGEGRCNGIIAVAETLARLGERVPFELVSLTGGRADNAIPDGAEAVIVVTSGDVEAVRAFIAERESQLKDQYQGIEKSVSLSTGEADMAPAVFEPGQQAGILEYVTRSMDGVNTMSAEIEGLVESSSNMGIVAVNADGITIRQMPRSSVADRLTEIEDYQKALGAECGLSVTILEGSRPWPVKAGSKIVPKIQEIYRALTGDDIHVEALHAALECGAFSELSPDLDMASIGPDLTGVHSPDETLYLVSVAKVWHLLEGLLVSLD